MSTPARILIADDHELVRQGLRAILTREPGWMVCGEAITGLEAITLAFELMPDVLIVDLTLPGINGLEVTRRVRRTLPVPVLVVTADDADRTVQEGVRAGAQGYVLKADAGRTLTDAVRALLAGDEYFSPHVRAAATHWATDGPATSTALTSREREVLPLLAAGLANKEIAATLGIATKTVETHRARIMSKLELHSMSDVVRYAVRNRIIEP